jgi:phenylalanyl-tRNA synthetase beta chain
VEVAGEPTGGLGELHPRVAARLDLPARVALVELDVGILAAHAGSGATYRDIPRFPPVRRDLAFTVDSGVSAAAVRAALEEAGGELVGAVLLFDVFEGDTLPQGTRSLAFSVDIRATDRTLTDREADSVVAAIVDRLAREFGAELRAG